MICQCAYEDVMVHEVYATGDMEDVAYFFGGTYLNLSKMAAASAACLLYTSPSPRDKRQSRMPSSA